MSRHLDKVLAHAKRQLESTGAQRPTDLLPVYQKFLKIEDHRLRLRHQAGGGGRDICALRVEMVDVLLRQVFSGASAAAEREKNTALSPMTMIALGGYGRGELNPCSDVDLMFLHSQSADKVSPFVTQTVEQILYLLWDIGFKIGHSTRSIREAILQANEDTLTKTAMLESRYLFGDTELFRQFRAQFREKCVRGREKDYIAARMQDQVRRHTKFGNSVHLQEPHVKSGCGGLRDYQNLLWITYFKEGALSTTQLVGKDWLTETDCRRIDAAYDFLLRVRTDLHLLNKRATDVLHLHQQPEIAQRLGYPQETPVRRNEAFMKDYYEHTRDIFRITERLTQQFATGTATTSTRLFFPFLPRRKSDEEKFGEFYSREGQLYAKRADLFSNDLVQISKSFQYAQERKLELSPEIIESLSQATRGIERRYRYAKEPRESFIQILSRKGDVGRTLRMMHRVDFLGHYVPEFGQLTCLVQHEFFHRYTADEHTLVCIEKLDALIATKNPKFLQYRKLFEQLPDPVVLYLTLLLHDTGKGVGARPHSEASALFAHRVATRLQLTPARRKQLVLLVDHHETLSNMAQQRNVDDPATVVEFAHIIKNQANLDALMLVTLADGQGTTDTWSDWKESLVWNLYHATSGYLANQEAFYQQTKIEREELLAAVFRKVSPDYAEEIEAHFDYMPDNYFRAFEVEEIASHLKLFREFWENLYRRNEPALTAAFHWQPITAQGHSVVSICTWDHQDLLANIAGSFSVVPLNILSADVYTRGDNLILDIFRVSDTKLRAVTDERDFGLVETTLRRALQNEQFDFRALLERARRRIDYRLGQGLDFPTSITIDNKTHPAYTLVQVQTPDRLGLLFDLLTCLRREGINIALSRISTEKGAAIDTFYVVDSNTRNKITDSPQLDRLHRRLQEAALRIMI